MRRLWRQAEDERGIAVVIALFVMALLLASGLFLMKLTATEGDIAYRGVWAEGSFFAADAAIAVALDQVAPGVTTATIASTSLSPSFTYSGSVQFSGTNQLPGYSLGSGTGYNPRGYVFYNFALSGTGQGPTSAQRNIDAQASYGPVAQ